MEDQQHTAHQEDPRQLLEALILIEQLAKLLWQLTF
jgi:hypothetical protein